MDAVGYALASAIEPYRWRQNVSAIPFADGALQAIRIGNKVYVLSMNYTQVYDIPSNTWSQEPPLPAGRKRTRFTACLVGDKIYVLGGVSTATGSVIPALRLVDIYDTAQKSWSIGTDIPPGSLGAGVVDAASAYVGGSLYLIGGRGGLNYGGAGDDTIRTVNALTISDGTWSKKADMPVALSSMGVAVYGDVIYIFGGYEDDSTASRARKEIRAYTPSSNTWAGKINMTTERQSCCAVLMGDKIYILGGESIVMVEEYKPTNNGLSIVQSPTTIFSYFGAVSYEGDVYVFANNYVHVFSPSGNSVDTLLAWLSVR